MQGEVLAGDYIPGVDEVGDEVDHSAIVGDSNLWDDLIFNREGHIVIEDTTSSSSKSQTETSSGSDGSSSNSSADQDENLIGDNSTKARTQIVSVTVEENV